MKKVFKTAAFLLAMGLMTSTFTSCGEDDGTDDGSTLEEKINFNGLNVVAQKNGQVLIDGKVTATAKIKSLVLSTDEDGKNVVIDLLKSGDQTKAKAIDEEGNKNKEFTLDIPTAAVDVQTMFLVGKTKGDKKASSQITETIKYQIGAANSSTCSYLSVTQNKAVNLDGAKENPSIIEVVANSSSDGNTVEGIKRASEAKIFTTGGSKEGQCAKVALYQNGASASVITDGGVIVTESGAICKVVKIETAAGSTDATFEGITMKGGLGAISKVDVSQCAPFSK